MGQNKKSTNFLTKLIAPISPKWALHRAVYQQLLERAAYTASDRGPRSAGWTTQNASGELTNQSERDIVRARGRDLERNSDMFTSIVLALERNIVGTGFMLQAKLLTPSGEEDEALNSRIEELWREWCKPKNCEITGRFNFSEVGALCIRRRYVDGGILVLKVFEAGKFKLQLLEVDDLDGTVQMHDGRRVIGGIEVDEFRRAVAYHIKVYDAWGFSVETRRIEAARVIYLPCITRPSQIREFTPAASSLGRIDDTNELIDAAVEKERVLAHLSAVVESDSGATLTGLAGMGRGLTDDTAPVQIQAAPQEILDQGTVTYLRPGEKISTVAPAGSSSTIEPMIKTTQRLAGGGMGLSYEVTSRDMSQVNYSSARQGLLEDKKTYQMLQAYMIDHFCDIVYAEWLNWAVLSGQLKIPEYCRNLENCRRHLWIPSGWDWIDPVKEANANRIALESNQTTLQEICASKGKDYKDVLRQRQLERELLGAPGEHDESDAKTVVSPADKNSEAAEIAVQGDSIQSISLNGAQIDSLISIVQMVAAGTFSYESALAILTSAFPLDEEKAKKILNSGKTIDLKEENTNAEPKAAASNQLAASPNDKS